MVHLITFFSKGPPYDNGRNLINVENRFRANSQPYVDTYKSFSTSDLEKSSWKDYSEYIQNHPNTPTNCNFQWARIGFCQWKPLIILRTLNEVAFGDIVFYHDVDCQKYYEYLIGMPNWGPLCEYLLELVACDLFVPCGIPMVYGTKSYLLHKFDLWEERESLGVWAGIVILKKTEIIMNLVRDWLDMCLDLDNISPVPCGKEDSRFIYHAGEQSILEVLLKVWCKNKKLSDSCMQYGLKNRIMRRSEIKLGSSLLC